MERKFTKFMALALTITLSLSACGVNTATGGRSSEASGSAVSGAAVTESISGSAVSEDGEMGRTSFSEKALWNSTNYYDSFDSEWIGTVLRQYTKDGKETGEFNFDDGKSGFYWLYADDNSIVYSVSPSGDDEVIALYELPLKKDKDGNDVITPSDAKELFKIVGEQGEFYHTGDKESNPIYVDGDSIILLGDTGRFIHYDRKSGKLTEKYPFGKESTFCRICSVYTEAKPQELYAQVDEYNSVAEEYQSNGLYAYNLKEGKWKRIISGRKISSENAYFYCLSSNSEGDKALFEVFDDDKVYGFETIYLRDVSNDTMSELVTYDMCRKLIEKEKIFDDRANILCEIECMPEGNGYSGDRQYFNVLVEAEYNKKCEASYVIFSTGFEKGDLRYEKQLTEDMWKTGTYKYVKDPIEPTYFEIENLKQYRVNLAFCLDVREGEAVFWYEVKERKEKTAVYDMATGNVRKIVESDGKWYERYEPAAAMLYEDMPNLQDDWYEEFDDDEAVYED